MFRKKIYKMFLKLYPNENQYKSTTKLTKLIFSIESLLIFFQKFKLLWRVNNSIKSWEILQPILNYVAYLSIDQLFAKYLGLYSFFILANSFIGLALCMLGVALKWKNQIQCIKNLCHIQLDLLSGILFIPFLIINLLILKYSFLKSSDRIEESIGNISKSELAFDSAGTVIALVSFILTIGLSFIHEGFSFNPKHSSARSDLKAKAHYQSDISNRLGTVLIAILYVFLSSSYYYFYLILAAITESYVFYHYIFYLPYYQRIINEISALIAIGIISEIFFFFIAIYLDNAYVILILSIFLIPAIALITHLFIQYRQLKIPKSLTYLPPLATFELICRENLINSRLSNTMNNYFQESFRRNTDKLGFVYLSYYLFCMNIHCKNAIIQISKIHHSGYNIFDNFQVYKCQKILEKSIFLNSEGLQVIIFIKSLKILQKFELKLFNTILSLCNSIKNRTPLQKNTKKKIFKIKLLIENIENKYIKAIEKFPHSGVLTEMYGSILLLLGQTEKGQKLIKNSIMLFYENRNKSKMIQLMSDKNANIMIVLANSIDFGLIKFMSKSLCAILSIENFKGAKQYLNDFIPKCFRKNHYKIMSKYLENFETEKVFNRIDLCLSDSAGFLVDCCLNVECVGYNSELYFVISVDTIEFSGRQIALINEIGDIFGHSKEFPILLRANSSNIEGENLFMYLPMITYADLCRESQITINTLLYHDKENMILELSLKKKNIGSQELILIYIINNKKLLHKCWNNLPEKHDKEGHNSKILPNPISKFKLSQIKNDEDFLQIPSRSEFYSEFNFCTVKDIFEVGESKKVLQIIRALRSLKIFVLISVKYI